MDDDREELKNKLSKESTHKEFLLRLTNMMKEEEEDDLVSGVLKSRRDSVLTDTM